MPGKVLTADAQRVYQLDELDKIPVLLIEVNAPELGTTIYLTDHSEPFVSAAGGASTTYFPAPMLDVESPPSEANRMPVVRYTLGINDASLVQPIREMSAAPTIRLMAVFEDLPDVVQDEIDHLVVTKIGMGTLSFQMEATAFPLFEIVGPRLSFTPDRAPGSFL